MTQIMSIMNERGDVPIDYREMKWKIRDYYEQQYATKTDNSDEQTLETDEYPSWRRKKQKILIGLCISLLGLPQWSTIGLTSCESFVPDL